MVSLGHILYLCLPFSPVLGGLKEGLIPSPHQLTAQHLVLDGDCLQNSDLEAWGDSLAVVSAPSWGGGGAGSGAITRYKC